QEEQTQPSTSSPRSFLTKMPFSKGGVMTFKGRVLYIRTYSCIARICCSVAKQGMLEGVSTVTVQEAGCSAKDLKEIRSRNMVVYENTTSASPATLIFLLLQLLFQQLCWCLL
ncbi:unnamed protein product, partial [Bubo scandiacus]